MIFAWSVGDEDHAFRVYAHVRIGVAIEVRRASKLAPCMRAIFPSRLGHPTLYVSTYSYERCSLPPPIEQPALCACLAANTEGEAARRGTDCHSRPTGGEWRRLAPVQAASPRRRRF